MMNGVLTSGMSRRNEHSFPWNRNAVRGMSIFVAAAAFLSMMLASLVVRQMGESFQRNHPSLWGWTLFGCFAVSLISIVLLAVWIHRKITKARGDHAPPGH
jgi:hypothetical protein